MEAKDISTPILSEIKTLEIKPEGRYLLVLPKSSAGTEAELTQLNEALKNLFGSARVLAIFVNEISDVKIAALMEEK